MPKRVIDFDAMWASDKLAACAEWAQAEYAWLYGLADCAGCFELTNLRVIWGRVAAIRKNFSIERLEQVIDEFYDKRLLFIWSANGKRYGHWTGSDVPGRLPPPSWRNRLERLAPPVPREQLEAFLAATKMAVVESAPRREPGGSSSDGRAASPAGDVSPACTVSLISARPAVEIKSEYSIADGQTLKPHLEVTQAQDLDLGLDLEGKWSEKRHTEHLEGANFDKDARSVCDKPLHLLELQKSKGSCLENISNRELEKCEGHRGNGKWSVAQDCPESRRGSVPQREDRPENVPPDKPRENQINASLQTSEKTQVPAKVAGDLSYTVVTTPEMLAEIWEQERGSLSELRGLTAERVARCRERIVNSLKGSLGKPGDAARFLSDFREAVRRAAATPFLCGAGPTGWRANFDWIVANDTNYLKVLEGRYDAGDGNAKCAGGSRKNSLSRDGDTTGRTNQSALGNWSARASARDEAARRMAHVGTGPQAHPSVRVRADVLHRATHRA